MSARVQVCITFLIAMALSLMTAESFAAPQEYVAASKTAVSYTVSITAETRLGSGFIIKDGNDYYVITHSSIVGKVLRPIVQAADGTEYEAEAKGSSPGAGLAVLKLLNVKGTPAVAKLGKSGKLEIGEKVIAAGRPQGYGVCVTAGIVSGMCKIEEIDFIQTDAALNPGQAGGPLVNLDGEVIGMCVVSTSQAQTGGRDGGGRGGPHFNPPQPVRPVSGLNLAIPIDAIYDAIKQVIRLGGTLATLGDLGLGGLQDVNRVSMEKYRLKTTEGALVRNLTKDGPAEKAGLRAGDIILEFDGKTVKDAAHLKELVQSTKMGAKVTVKFAGMREEKAVSDKVTIELPEPKSDEISGDPPSGEEDIVDGSQGEAVAVSSLEQAQALPVASVGGEATEYIGAITRAASSVIRIGENASAVMLFKNIAPGDTDARYLVTAAHLVGKSEKVRLTFHKKGAEGMEPVSVEGEVVGADQKTDIAVIRVRVVGGPESIACADVGKIEIGDEVLAVGAGPAATAGIISMKNMRPREGFVRGFFTTTARVFRDNDGGALVDTSGRLVGICTTAGDFTGRFGMSFVIPADLVQEVARDIILKGSAKSGYLGLEAVRNLTEAEMKQHEIKQGVVIQKVVKSSPAEKAGLKEGQIILKFDGDIVRNVEHLKVLADAALVGRKVEVVIIDADGTQKTVQVEITEKK